MLFERTWKAAPAHPSFQSRGYTCPERKCPSIQTPINKRQQIATSNYEIAFNPRPLCSQPQQLHHLRIFWRIDSTFRHMDFSQAAEEDVTLQVQVQKVQESQHRLEPLCHHFTFDSSLQIHHLSFGSLWFPWDAREKSCMFLSSPAGTILEARPKKLEAEGGCDAFVLMTSSTSFLSSLAFCRCSRVLLPASCIK